MLTASSLRRDTDARLAELEKIIEGAIENYSTIIMTDIQRAANQGKFSFNFGVDYILGNEYVTGIFSSVEKELVHFDTAIVRDKQIKALRKFFEYHGYRCSYETLSGLYERKRGIIASGFTIYW